jgi:hypothetical protein
MKVDCLYWNSARVTCPSDPSKSRAFGRCYVECADGLLRIRERDGNRPKDVSYTETSVVRLDMSGAEFKAYWFSFPFGSSESDARIPAEVTCEF